jgi:probable LLM family oxidoreductase
MVIELGVDTFGDTTFGPDGALLPHDQVLRNIVDEGVLADQVGIDFFGIGEHHRADFAVSSPETVLAAIAARTSRIRLGSAVTVLSSDDPVRVFQRFSTLNALSGGRAEVILGRGSFTESFPLFGLDLRQYEVLFEEKLDLFVKLTRQQKVTWSGTTRAALTDQSVYPTLAPSGLATWIGVGGSPESVVRAVGHDLPMMLAIIGGDPRRFRPFVDLYHRAWAQTGKPSRPLGVHSMGFIAETETDAREIAWPHYRTMRNRIGAERGWPPVSPEEYSREIEHGSLYIGTAQTVAAKITRTAQSLGLDRFEMKYSLGTLPHDHLMRTIEAYGTQVIPLVRDMLTGKPKTASAPGRLD